MTDNKQQADNWPVKSGTNKNQLIAIKHFKFVNASKKTPERVHNSAIV